MRWQGIIFSPIVETHLLRFLLFFMRTRRRSREARSPMAKRRGGAPALAQPTSCTLPVGGSSESRMSASEAAIDVRFHNSQRDHHPAVSTPRTPILSLSLKILVHVPLEHPLRRFTAHLLALPLGSKVVGAVLNFMREKTKKK